MAAITEDFVSFETAKLLKEKGFDEDINFWYNENGNEIFYQQKYDIMYNWRVRQGLEIYQCPTLQMAMKWLREEHKLYIQIWMLEERGYWFNIEKILNAQYKHKSLYSTGIEDIYFEFYEEVCEAAIKYCLVYLI